MRRLLVLAVCTLGVTSLYLAPGIARAPHQVSGPQPQPQPRGQTTPSPTSSVIQEASATSDVESTPLGTPSAPDSTGTPDPEPSAETDPPVEPTRAPVEPPVSRTGATAFDPADRQDEEPPAPVGGLSTGAVTPMWLTLRWPPAEDNVGVVGYKVVLNGFEVATTPETHAKVAWFNDDARQQLVQVRAVDAAGNESPSSANLLVARPTSDPGPEPSEGTPSPTEPSPTPEPAPAPSPSPSGTDTGPDQPDDSSSAEDLDIQDAPTDEEN